MFGCGAEQGAATGAFVRCGALTTWRRSRRGSRVALSFRLPTFRKLILASLVLSCAINRLIGLIKKALYQKQIKCNLIV